MNASKLVLDQLDNLPGMFTTYVSAIVDFARIIAARLRAIERRCRCAG